jgi:tetratricopeptide (TPR) repeat protein
MPKRLIGIALAVIIVIFDLTQFSSQARVERARLRTSKSERVIEILEGGRTLVPWNDPLYHELGRAYFQAGVSRLQDASGRDADFRSSYRNYLRALALNPLSAVAHFDFAQALRYMSFFDLGISEDALDEFKKAARLSGTHPQIYAEAGKAMFARWSTLSAEDRAYARTIVRTVLQGNPSAEDVETFLGLWELNVKDPAVLDEILPKDAAVDRQAARFLGERSLSRDGRIRFRARADVLDFQTARDEFAAGQTDIGRLRLDQARAHFRDGLAALDRIVFAQNLIGQDSIDRLEFRDLAKSLRLGLAKCALEETRKLDGALENLTAYLDLEDSTTAVGELEMFLKERNIIEGKTGIGVQDFNRFFIEVLLGFKQNRFREIIQAGVSLERSLLVISEAMKPAYVRILELIGDSYRKLDYLYESNGFYAKALERGGPGVGILLKMRKNYERLNDPERMKSVDKNIWKLLPEGAENFADAVLGKTAPLSRTYVLDGRKFALTILFEDPGLEPFPLVTVLFNGQLAWEDYLGGRELKVVLPSEIGRNSIEVSVANRPIRLKALKMSPVSEPGR